MKRNRAMWALRLVAGGTTAYLAWRKLRQQAANLAGQVVLITGSSRGLGLLMAQEFAREGCKLVICARDAQELDRARQELERHRATVLAVPCDVTQREQVESLIIRATDRFGRIDILVNNAGIIQVGPLENMTMKDFEQAMAVDFWGAVYPTLAVLPQMRDRRSGRIVNITSIGGKVAIPHMLPYDCAKFAVVGFSEGLRAELARDGVLVTTIVPGLMRTGSPVNAFFKGQAEREFTWFSLGDALPLTSINAKRAAQRIIKAVKYGEGEVTLSWQAWLLGLAHDLFPGATADLLGLVNRALPKSGDSKAVRGMRLVTSLAPSILTRLMNRAAREYNQYGGTPKPAPEHARKVGLVPEQS